MRDWIANGLLLLGVALLITGLVLFSLVLANTEFLYHPLGICTGTRKMIEECRSYNFWSGSGSDISEITLAFAVLSIAIGGYRKVNCHHYRCWRIGRFHAGHYVVCHKHHPEVPDDGKITQEHINDAHTAATC